MKIPSLIHILITDDSELVRLGLKTLLQDVPDMEVMGMAKTAAEAFLMCEQLSPDVILLDIRLPDTNGISLCRQILAKFNKIKVLFLTSCADQDTVNGAIQAGAHGYLLKEINAASLIHGIRDVAVGKSVLDPQIAEKVMNLLKSERTKSILEQLSPQEQRVLAKIAEGLTNKEVANELSLSEKTVKNYLSNIFEKLHFKRRTQAIAYYSQVHKSQ